LTPILTPLTTRPKPEDPLGDRSPRLGDRWLPVPRKVARSVDPSGDQLAGQLAASAWSVARLEHRVHQKAAQGRPP
jgi:hypothetical protein